MTASTFIPLMVLFVGFCGAITGVQLSVAAYRHKKIPDMSAIAALIVGFAAIWLAHQQTNSPIFAGILLFFGGYGGFMAVAMSAIELKPKSLNN